MISQKEGDARKRFSLRFRQDKLKISLQQAEVPPLAGFPVRNFHQSISRSLTPQQATGNALAIAVQKGEKLYTNETQKECCFWQFFQKAPIEIVH